MGQGHPQPRHTPSTTAGGELGAQGTRAPSPAAGPHAPPQPPGPADCLQLLSPRSPAGLPPEGDRALHRVAGPGSQPTAGRTPPPHAPWGQRCQEGCSGYHGGSPPLHPTSCSPSRVTQSHKPHRKAEGRLHLLLTLPHLHGVLGGGLSCWQSDCRGCSEVGQHCPIPRTTPRCPRPLIFASAPWPDALLHRHPSKPHK